MSTAAGFVVFRRMQCEIEYLLLRASYGSKHWSPPKGYVDPGEDVYTTAMRELREETGYCPKNHHPDNRITIHECLIFSLCPEDLLIYKEHEKELHYPVKGVDKRVVYWLAELKDPKKEVKLSEEHLDMKWLDYKRAIAFSNYKDFVEMLGQYEDIIKNCL